MKQWIFIILSALILLPAAADFRFGQDLYNDGLYDEAIAELERVIALSPTSLEAQQSLFLIGESYRAQKNFSRAEDAYLRLWEGYPMNSFKDKILYYLGLVQFQQKKYPAAAANFSELLTSFPLSEFAGSALGYSLQSSYYDGDYNQVIVNARKYEKNYASNPALPDVLLWKAKAYFANNIPAEGRKTLDTIIAEYPDAPAQWQAFELQMELLQQESGVQAAIDELSKRLQEEIPRAFEERLRATLIELYLQQKQYRPANIELAKLINKFNNSAKLDEYLIAKCKADMELGLYQDVVTMQTSQHAVFKESPLKDLFNYYGAAAQIALQHYEQAQQQLDILLQSTVNDSVRAISTILLGSLKEKQGRQREAVEFYQSQLGSPYIAPEEILFHIGSIYFHSFGQYSTALNYYRQIVSATADPLYQARAAYQAALCLEQMNDFNAALQQLQSVALNRIPDDTLRNRIERKTTYYRSYRQQDYQQAFGSLLDALYRYLDTSDKPALQQQLIRILAQDLKAYDQALAVADGAAKPQIQYERARIFLQLAQRQMFEAQKVAAGESLKQVNLIIAELDSTQHDQWIRELQIKRRLIDEEISKPFIAEINEYINRYPATEAANEFRLTLGRHLMPSEPATAVVHFQALQLVSAIEAEDFYQAKIDAAEYYYSKDDDAQALELYRLADQRIKLSQPQVYFHYAVVLNESGQTGQAIDKLAFLINNADEFEGYDSTITYFTRILRAASRYEEAIQYQLLIPANRRSDEFYRTLSGDYLALGNKEKAKESLMYIVEKNQEILADLAQLQLDTGDLVMAAYSYGELTKRDAANLHYIDRLGHIAFLQERYLDAAVQYKKIVDKLGEKFETYDNIAALAKENIIALYRVQNRPKAETLTKRFKKQLDETALNEIALNEAIYYQDIELKTAKKLYEKLLKKENLDEAIKMQAHFWRGVMHLKNKENDAALADFQQVTKAQDAHLRNQAYLKLGTINFTQENYDQALADYFYVIQNDDQGELAKDAARNFAFVAKRLEQWQKAVSAYEIILERWGDTGLQAETIFDIAFCHYRDKKYSNAVEMFRNAVSLLATDLQKAEAQYWLGESYYGMDLYETAITEFLKVSYNYPAITDWAASAELRAGECYLKMRQFAKAKTIFQRVVSKFGAGSNYGLQAQEHLRNL
jgi:tetratricopeptide (TPR) repeat protein